MRNQWTGTFRGGVWLGAIAVATVAVGCGRNQAPASIAPDVWAVVDDRQITREDVEKAYRLSVQNTATPQPEAEALAAKMNILDELITQDVLQARARAANVEASDTEVDNALAEQKRSMTDEAFQLELTGRGVTLDDIKRGIRRQLSVQKLIDKDVTTKVAVTDQEITAYYEQNRAQFNFTEPQFRLAQIVISGTPDAQIRNRRNDDARTPEEAKQKLQAITQRISAGEDFAVLALDYSEDPNTAPQGGDLGFVPLSTINRAAPMLRTAVLRMKPGEVNTMTAGSTYTIMLLVGQEPAGQRELSTPAVRDGIRDMLRGRQEELLRVAYLTAARTDARITNNLAHQVVAGLGKIPAAAAAK